MTNSLVIFGCTFLVVFALDLQSLNMVGNHRALAVVTSVVIGSCNLTLLKLILAPTGAIDIVAYLAGGAIGCLCAMAAHPHLVRLGKRGCDA